MDQMKIGQLIARKRKEQGLTQEQLAERLGVTNKAVSKWENGKCMPDLSLLCPLCEILGLSLTAFLSGEETEIEAASPIPPAAPEAAKSEEQVKTERLVMKLLWIIEGLKQLWCAITGLLICNVPYAIEDIRFIADIPEGTFLRGLVNGSMAGLKLVGAAVFAYGLIKYIQKRQAGKKTAQNRKNPPA